MAYKWKPSKAQRREFAEKMQNDQEYREAYYDRKQKRDERRRASSEFDYKNAGGFYIPTKQQHDFCMNNMHLFENTEKESAANIVIYGYSCNEKVHHDYIHIVNEKIRNNKHHSV